MVRMPGCENVEADKESRIYRRCTAWCLRKTVFTNACAKLSVTHNIDLFASRINCQITPYVSYRADPAAFAINAFHMSWQYHLFYAFPPFSLITVVLQKCVTCPRIPQRQMPFDDSYQSHGTVLEVRH